MSASTTACAAATAAACRLGLVAAGFHRGQACCSIMALIFLVSFLHYAWTQLKG